MTGPRGLFAGYLPTLLEDVPDMAFKFAAYETLRTLHSQLRPGRPASVQVGSSPLHLRLSHMAGTTCSPCRDFSSVPAGSLSPFHVTLWC